MSRRMNRQFQGAKCSATDALTRSDCQRQNQLIRQKLTDRNITLQISAISALPGPVASVICSIEPQSASRPQPVMRERHSLSPMLKVKLPPFNACGRNVILDEPMESPWTSALPVSVAALQHRQVLTHESWPRPLRTDVLDRHGLAGNQRECE